MADIVNLNQFRKKRRRAGKKAVAATNRTKFGRTRVERIADRREQESRDRDLDGKKIEEKE